MLLVALLLAAPPAWLSQPPSERAAVSSGQGLLEALSDALAQLAAASRGHSLQQGTARVTTAAAAFGEVRVAAVLRTQPSQKLGAGPVEQKRIWVRAGSPTAGLDVDFESGELTHNASYAMRNMGLDGLYTALRKTGLTWETWVDPDTGVFWLRLNKGEATAQHSPGSDALLLQLQNELTPTTPLTLPDPRAGVAWSAEGDGAGFPEALAQALKALCQKHGARGVLSLGKARVECAAQGALLRAAGFELQASVTPQGSTVKQRGDLETFLDALGKADAQVQVRFDPEGARRCHVRATVYR